VLSPLSRDVLKPRERFLVLWRDQTFDLPKLGSGPEHCRPRGASGSPRPGWSNSMRIAPMNQARAIRRALFDGASDGAFTT
jgi:hypothetical protein